MNERILGIIGTAGRGDDAAKLTIEKYNEAKWIAARFITERGIKTLVSGGAAVVDHIAVQAFNAGFVDKLYLELPCEFDIQEGMFKNEGAGTISNLYHNRFKFSLGVDSLMEIRLAIQKGAVVAFGGGFHARNTEVARKSDILLAYTFGDGENLKDGGTADTMRKYIARRGDGDAYHVDLHTMKLYQGAKV